MSKFDIIGVYFLRKLLWYQHCHCFLDIHEVDLDLGLLERSKTVLFLSPQGLLIESLVSLHFLSLE